MENFKKLIKTEIFNDIKKSKVVAKKIEYLFNAFVANKDILEEVQNHFDTTISSNEKFSETDKKKISSLLKKYWLNAWIEKPLTQKDIDIIPRYFDTYTYLQQAKLNTKIKQFSKKINFEVKDVPVLTTALASYKEGKPDELQKYVHSQAFISSTDIKRIFSFLEDHDFNKQLINHTLGLFTQALSKISPSIGLPFSSPRIYSLLKQPTNDWISFITACDDLKNREKNNYYTKNELSLHKLALLTPLVFNSKKQFLISVVDMFSRLRDFDADNIENSLKNIDVVLKSTGQFFPNFMNKKFNIQTTGIDALFECIDIIKNNFKNLREDLNVEDEVVTFDDLVGYIKNVTSVYYKNTLSSQLSEKKTTTKTLKI